MPLISMEKQHIPIPWDKLPSELKSGILKEVAQGESMEEILENLKDATKVSKEFRAMAKSIAMNPEEVNNIAKMYIQKNPKAAYQEFFRAVRSGKIDIVKALLSGNIDVDAYDPNGNTALINATEFGNKNIAEILIKAGANVNAKSKNKSEATALIRAAVLNVSPEIVKILLDANADLDVQNANGFTALMLAAANGKLKFVKLLLSKGANPKLLNKRNETALDMASRTSMSNTEAIVELLKNAVQEK